MAAVWKLSFHNTSVFGIFVKVLRVCNEVAALAEHGVRALPAMDGLLDEQGLGIQINRIIKCITYAWTHEQM